MIGNSPFLTAVHSSVNLLEELGLLSSHYPLADKYILILVIFLMAKVMKLWEVYIHPLLGVKGIAFLLKNTRQTLIQDTLIHF